MSSVLKVDAIQNTAGTSALTIDSAGRPITPARPSFKAHNSAVGWQSLSSTGDVKMPFDATQHNVGTHYDTSNYKFVAPCDGIYYFYSQIYHDANTQMQLKIKENGSTEQLFSNSRDQGHIVQGSIVLELTANDYLEVFGKISNSDSSDYYAYPSYSYFCGYLIG